MKGRPDAINLIEDIQKAQDVIRIDSMKKYVNTRGRSRFTPNGITWGKYCMRLGSNWSLCGEEGRLDSKKAQVRWTYAVRWTDSPSNKYSVTCWKMRSRPVRIPQRSKSSILRWMSRGGRLCVLQCGQRPRVGPGAKTEDLRFFLHDEGAWVGSWCGHCQTDR